MIGQFLIVAGLITLPGAGPAVWRAPVLRTESRDAGQIYFQVLVTPDRNVQECVVVYSDFPGSLGDRGCENLRRVQFETSATDSQGRAVHGYYVFGGARYSSGDRPSASDRKILPDIVATVESLPASLGDLAEVTLHVEVDPGGNVQACEGSSGSASAPSLAACDLVRTYRFPEVSDVQGQPVSYVRAVRVAFELSEA